MDWKILLLHFPYFIFSFYFFLHSPLSAWVIENIVTQKGVVEVACALGTLEDNGAQNDRKICSNDWTSIQPQFYSVVGIEEHRDGVETNERERREGVPRAHGDGVRGERSRAMSARRKRIGTFNLFYRPSVFSFRFRATNRSPTPESLSPSLRIDRAKAKWYRARGKTREKEREEGRWRTKRELHSRLTPFNSASQ